MGKEQPCVQHSQGQFSQNEPQVETSSVSEGRIVRIGLVVNLALAGTKLIGGWIFQSKSLTADGWHSVTDLVIDGLALLAVLVRCTLRTANIQKSTVESIERFMSVSASSLLVVLGVHMGWESVSVFKTQFAGQSAHTNNDLVFTDLDHLCNHTPSMNALWLAALTIFVKEWLYRATMKVAIENKSAVLASSAVHQRADSFMSVVTIFAILGSNILKDTAWIDGIGGLCISIMVVHASLENISMAFSTGKHKSH